MIRPTDSPPIDPTRDTVALHDGHAAPMIETLGVMPDRARTDAVRFRADTDQTGQWHVWERMGGGWSAVKPCDCRLSARRLADEWNRGGKIG